MSKSERLLIRNLAADYTTEWLEIRIDRLDFLQSLRRGLVAARLSHDEIERPWTDLAETAIAVERYGDGYGRIISLELHTAGNQKVIKLVDVQWFTALA